MAGFVQVTNASKNGRLTLSNSLLAVTMAVIMGNRILIVEDEPSIADAISYALQTEGFIPMNAGTGHKALELLASDDSIVLAIVDIGLPDMNGFELLKRVRETSKLPLLFLTARTGEIDRVVGLELGADDYVSKPFSPRELTARVRAILRRANDAEPANAAKASHAVPPFVIDEERRTIKYHGHPLDLSRYEYRLLCALIGSRGRVFSRDQLMDRISEAPEMSMERSVDTHIKTIRQKLRRISPDTDPIVTHRGFGYSLKEL